MINIKTIVSALGTLVPIIFPDKEFKPKRLGAVVILTVVAVLAIEYVGEGKMGTVLESVETLSDLTEE